MNATQFARAIRVEIPRRVEADARRVMFDVASQLHEAIDDETPVDTGYLRSSQAFTAGGEEPERLEPPTTEGRRGRVYREVRPSPGAALARAVRDFVPFTIGFRAAYAVHVEDKVGMVKSAHARAEQFVRRAIANVRGTSPGGAK